MRLPVYAGPEDLGPIAFLGDSTSHWFDVHGNAINVAAGSTFLNDTVYADVPLQVFAFTPSGPLLILPRRVTREARARFLGGEGTLTVEDVRQWAGQLGLDYELDGCKDPTPKLMVAAIEQLGHQPPRLIPSAFVR